MKIDFTSSFNNVPTFEDLRRYTTLFARNVTAAINGRLSFSDNFAGQFLEATFSGAGVDLTLTHGLNREPEGYLVTRNSSGIVIYDGSIENTTTQVTLRATGAGSVTLFIF